MSQYHPVTTLQADITAIINKHAPISEVTVYSRAKGVTEQDIVHALTVFNESEAGKAGAVIIVMMPLLDVPLANVPGPRFDANVTIRVIENPLFNRDTENGGTGLSAEAIMLEICHLLHGRRLHPHIRELYIDQDASTPVELSDDTVAYDINIKTGFQLDAPERVKDVVFTGDASALQLGCNTPAASVYYTTDGSYPDTENGELYGITLLTDGGLVLMTENGETMDIPQPLSLDPGTLVRASAIADGMQDSNATAWIAPNE